MTQNQASQTWIIWNSEWWTFFCWSDDNPKNLLLNIKTVTVKEADNLKERDMWVENQSWAKREVFVWQGGVGWVGGGEGGEQDDARAHQVTPQPSSADHKVSIRPECWIVFFCLNSPTSKSWILCCVLNQNFWVIQSYFSTKQIFPYAVFTSRSTFGRGVHFLNPSALTHKTGCRRKLEEET